MYDVLRQAEAEGWLADLVGGARASNPGNPDLLAFAQLLNLAPAVVATKAGREPAVLTTRPEFERIVRESNRMQDIAQWRARMGEIEGRVCRVEINRRPLGTGFLLGPDVLITNYHVAEELAGVGGSTPPGQFVARFDYKVLPGATVPAPGIEVGLAAADHVIDCSRPSRWDTIADPQGALPAANELDYALLRLARPVGDEPIGGPAEPGAPARGWIELPSAPYTFAAGGTLIIVQHPDAAPLAFAIDTDAVLTAHATRVRYATNTQPGSSGSPVFNSDWDLVALHHSGDHAFFPEYNEGIPVAAIRNLLEQRNLLGELGAPTL